MDEGWNELYVVWSLKPWGTPIYGSWSLFRVRGYHTVTIPLPDIDLPRHLPDNRTKYTRTGNTVNSVTCIISYYQISISLLHRRLYLQLIDRLRNPLREFLARRYIRDKQLPPPSFMNSSIYHDDIQPGMILKDCDIVQRFPIDKDTVCKVASLDLAHLVRAHKQFGDAIRSRDDRLVGSETQQLGEVL